MRIDIRKVAKILIEFTADKKDEDMRAAVKETVQFLNENGELNEWRGLEQSIHSIWREKYGASQVTITSAHELNADAAQRLQKLVCGADLYQHVDASLIGGAVLRIDDKRIDGSISGALKRLKFSLSN